MSSMSRVTSENRATLFISKRVIGIGPQIGYIFPVDDMQGFLGVKAYGEFDAANRPSGWNTWADICDFAGSPHRRDANQAPGDEIGFGRAAPAVIAVEAKRRTTPIRQGTGPRGSLRTNPPGSRAR